MFERSFKQLNKTKNLSDIIKSITPSARVPPSVQDKTPARGAAVSLTLLRKAKEEEKDQDQDQEQNINKPNSDISIKISDDKSEETMKFGSNKTDDKFEREEKTSIATCEIKTNITTPAVVSDNASCGVTASAGSTTSTTPAPAIVRTPAMHLSTGHLPQKLPAINADPITRLCLKC